MKHQLLAASAAILLAASASTLSQPYGMGPGEGYGPGYGMGPGMMGGYGPGYGMGPGMMGGYGPGYGMGPGMMGGYGPWGYGVDLTAEQRAKLAEIRQDMQRKQWALMGKMHEQGSPMYDAFAGGKFDEQAARKAFDAMTALRKQMFENWLEARKRMDAVFTPEQREQMQRGPRRR
jgi:Spy/CpxP family protein refolding chaperone